MKIPEFIAYSELLESPGRPSLASIPVCYKCVRIVNVERSAIDCPKCGHALFWDRVAYKKLKGVPVFKSNLAHYASDESLAVQCLHKLNSETLNEVLYGKQKARKKA